MTGPYQPETVPDACDAAQRAFLRWSALNAVNRAGTLRAVAGALDERRDDIITTAVSETALFAEELAPEFARMTGTLRQFAQAVERASWHIPAIDHAVKPGTPGLVGPGHDVRRTLVPLGPVAVFGASNFPLAYGVIGGDTASALAAGCSVVVKEHPAHPSTGRLIHAIAAASLEKASGVAGVLSYVANEDPMDHAVAKNLVQHPAFAAVGFTGSIPGGLAVERLARERAVPIPVFAEMGSVNPVFITPGAMDARGVAIADLIADSVLMRHGQQCTCPGVVFFAKSDQSPAFAERMKERFTKSAFRAMLAPWVRDAYNRRNNEIEESGAASLEAFSQAGNPMGPGPVAQAQVWGTALHQWNTVPVLREECFGPSTIFVVMPSWEDQATAVLSGSLTLSIFFDENDAVDTARAREVLNRHAATAGRIIFNGVPTGVRVAPGMVHSGPFPACNRPDSTAVGPHAIARWCRPVCFQNCPDVLLPAELQIANPMGLTRRINGVLTQ